MELKEDRWNRLPPVEISTIYNLPWSQFAEQCIKTVIGGPGATRGLKPGQIRFDHVSIISFGVFRRKS